MAVWINSGENTHHQLQPIIPLNLKVMNVAVMIIPEHRNNSSKKYTKNTILSVLNHPHETNHETHALLQSLYTHNMTPRYHLRFHHQVHKS